MRWTEERTIILADRIAELFREFAILWLTFSLLDKLVAGQLTIPWLLANGLFSIAAIVAGTYIELRTKHAE